MNTKYLLLIVTLLLMTLGVQAQKLTVESMTVAGNDISASQYRVNDINGQACALVKVHLTAVGATFEGNVIPPVEYKTNEYWVYMTEGSKELHIKHPNYLTLKVLFSDYGLMGLQPLTTYVLTVSQPQEASVQTQKLTINYKPADAMVLVDSRPYQGNGKLELTLPVGNHEYQIAAVGYATVEGAVKLNIDAPRTINEELTVKKVVQQTAARSTQESADVALNLSADGPDEVDLDVIAAHMFGIPDMDAKEKYKKAKQKILAVYPKAKVEENGSSKVIMLDSESGFTKTLLGLPLTAKGQWFSAMGLVSATTVSYSTVVQAKDKQTVLDAAKRVEELFVAKGFQTGELTGLMKSASTGTLYSKTMKKKGASCILSVTPMVADNYVLQITSM